MKRLLTILFILSLALPAHGVTRLYDRSTGDIVDADKDDAEWDNTNNAINTHVADTSAHDATGGVVGASKVQTLSNKFFNGSFPFYAGALNFYPDSGQTILKGRINAITGKALLGINSQGLVQNCEINISGSTLTISGDGGTALSATEPCIVGIRSNTAGDTTLAYFTANVTATFGATSNTDGNLFGISAAAWANTMPMFFGVVFDGTTPYFTISRLPYIVTGAASTALCEKDDTDCDAQSDMMIIVADGTLTLANWVNLPVTQVGWFDATADASANWTFALTEKNGFNANYETVEFSMVTGQMGASAGSFCLPNGGTPPTYTETNSYSYSIDKNGFLSGAVLFSNASGGTAGAGAVNLRISIPYSYTTPSSVNDTYGAGVVQVQDAGVPLDTLAYFSEFTDSNSFLQIIYQSTIGTVRTAVTNAMQSNASRRIRGKYRVRVF